MSNPEKPKHEICPACREECRGLFSWKDQDENNKLTCLPCRENGLKAKREKLEAQRRAFREEAEHALASERDAKKKEALKQQPGRIELGHWVENIDGMQFMTKITAVSAASVTPKAQRWLWQNRIPAGAITWGVGKPGNAKSLWATDLAARYRPARTSQTVKRT